MCKPPFGILETLFNNLPPTCFQNSNMNSRIPEVYIYIKATNKPKAYSLLFRPTATD